MNHFFKIFFVIVLSVSLFVAKPAIAQPYYNNYDVEEMDIEEAKRMVQEMQESQGVDISNQKRNLLENYYTKMHGEDFKKQYEKYAKEQEERKAQEKEENKYAYGVQKKKNEAAKKLKKHVKRKKHKAKKYISKPKNQYFKRKISKEAMDRKKIKKRSISHIRELR